MNKKIQLNKYRITKMVILLINKIIMLMMAIIIMIIVQIPLENLRKVNVVFFQSMIKNLNQCTMILINEVNIDNEIII